MTDNKTKFFYSTFSCYISLSRYDFLSDTHIKDFPYAILAGTIISKIKFPHNILDNFMTCMKHLESNSCKSIKEFIEYERKSIYKILKVNNETNFIYGIDEYLLSVYISRYIITNKISYSFTVKNGMERVFYNWYLNSNKFKDEGKYIGIMKSFLGKYYEENKSVEDNYKILDKVIYYKEKNKSKIKDSGYIFDNIVRVFRGLEGNGDYEKYGFRWRDVFCIVDYPIQKGSLKSFHFGN
jgi:hypothetical protein